MLHLVSDAVLIIFRPINDDNPVRFQIFVPRFQRLLEIRLHFLALIFAQSYRTVPFLHHVIEPLDVFEIFRGELHETFWRQVVFRYSLLSFVSFFSRRFSFRLLSFNARRRRRLFSLFFFFYFYFFRRHIDRLLLFLLFHFIHRRRRRWCIDLLRAFVFFLSYFFFFFFDISKRTTTTVLGGRLIARPLVLHLLHLVHDFFLRRRRRRRPQHGINQPEARSSSSSVVVLLLVFHQIESIVVFFPGLSFINEREVVDAKDTDDEHAHEREKQKRTPETKFDSLARRSG
mmetsp:Transcript_997/g.3117  ORF Transcript_997/g.3117 Transcript_997/m.3117 type:complete len:287 (+) Transcript_997:1471-2331(+)